MRLQRGMRSDTFGGLTVRLTGGRDREGGGEPGDPTVILLHGFGAPGEDLVPLWRVLDVPRATRFVFPAAPIDLGRQFAGGRAWWRLDMERMQQIAMGSTVGDDEAHGREIPEGLVEARAQVSALVDEVSDKMPGPLVLGGFSQGAMLACDVALRSPRPLAGLVLMSGTVLAVDEWRALAPSRKGLPVLLSHGERDPLLAFAAAQRLRKLLDEAGLVVDWVPFPGGHEIPQSVLDGVGRLVTRVAASR